MSIFEKDFDMKRYIEDRLLEIPNLDSRRDFRDLMLRVFTNLYNEVEEQYQALEYRVLNELPTYRHSPELITTMISRNRYDVTDEFMYPVRPSDADEPVIDKFAMTDLLREGKEYCVRNVYVALPPAEIDKLKDTAPIFNGLIFTNHGHFPAKFRLDYDDWYLKKAQEFYSVVLSNFIAWRCLCVPYFYKTFKLNIVSLPEFDIEDEIEKVQVDFADYKKNVWENLIPCWNVSKIELKTSTYPEPCIDAKKYEHLIFSHNFNASNEYLVYNDEALVSGIRWLDGDLIITSPDPEPVIWKLYEFHQQRVTRTYEHPLMTNGMRESIADKLSNYYGITIRSIVEIRRILACHKIDGPELLTFYVEDNEFDKETYLPDSFVSDEIRTSKKSQAIIFEFIIPEHNKDSYLDYDVVSYYVGILQHYFPEYECCGLLVPSDTTNFNGR